MLFFLSSPLFLILISTFLVHRFTASMADYHYGGSEEENAELKKLETDLV